MKFWLKYLTAIGVMFSFVYCSHITEKVEQKVNEKVDEKINETIKKIDTGASRISLDSLKRMLDTIGTKSDTSVHRAGKKKHD
jgi:hypothetical protein